MLVSIQTGFRTRHMLTQGHIPSANAFGAHAIGPQLDKVLTLTAGVANAQSFGAHTIENKPPTVLTVTAGLVNANVVSPKTISSMAPPVTTSYSNPKGSGNRTATITVTSSGGLFASGSMANLIDGTYAATAYFNVVGGAWMKFDFGTPRLFDAFKWSQSNAMTHGNWKWQGSADDASYVDVGAPFTLEGITGGAPWEILEPAGNTTKYRYWKMQQVSGGTSGGPYVTEIEFKIDAGP